MTAALYQARLQAGRKLPKEIGFTDGRRISSVRIANVNHRDTESTEKTRNQFLCVSVTLWWVCPDFHLELSRLLGPPIHLVS
jgi:hypothetical protein